MPIQQKGIYAALISNILFALIYLYSAWMKPLSGTDVFAWRMLGMCAALWLILLLTRSTDRVFAVLRRVQRRRQWWLLLGTTAIIASQLWLFMWGPVNGYGLDIAVGYFLFPMVMVLAGRIFFVEQLNLLQWLAVLLAAIGVAIDLWHSSTFSWVTAWIIATYPLYYLIRRLIHIPALPGLTIDLSLIAPIALMYLWQQEHTILPDPQLKYLLLIISLGLLSAIAMQSNLYAAYNLPVALFGMFSYLEPTLLFMLSFLILKAQAPATALWTYSLIGGGIFLMLANNYLHLKKNTSSKFSGSLKSTHKQS